MSEKLNILHFQTEPIVMRRLLIGILLLMNAGILQAQTRILELGTRKLDISALNQRGQQQFEADVEKIKGDPRLKEVYAADVKKYFQSFTGTDEEKTKILAKIARQIVTNNSNTSTRPTGAAALSQIDPQITADLGDRNKIINRSVTISSDGLMKRQEELEIISDTTKSNPPPRSEDPDPLRPSSTNTFKGEIAYVLPDTMEVGKTERVRLVVAIDPEVARQLANRTEGDLTSGEIGIGRYMKAELTDYNAFGDEEGSFTISLWKGDAIQIIDPEDPDAAIIWEWRVRPKVSGEQILGVKVSIILFDDRLPNGRGYQSLDTYEQPVLIMTNPASGSEPVTAQANSEIQGSPGKRIEASKNSLMFKIIGGIVLLFLLGFITYMLSKRRATRVIAKEKERALPLVEAGDGKADPEEIKTLIKAGKFEAAAGELKDLVILRNYSDRSAIIALQARIQHWENDVHNNVIDGESARQERSRITLALLHTLEEIMEEAE